MTTRSHLSEKSVTLKNFHGDKRYFICIFFVFILYKASTQLIHALLYLIISYEYIIFLHKSLKINRN